VEILKGIQLALSLQVIAVSSGTISEMLMSARVPGRGEINARLFKHLSPVTFSLIHRAVPLTGRLNFYERSFAYVLTNVTNGEEKAKKVFRKGDVAFMPAGSMICFFLEDTRSYKPMNPLGVVTSGLEVLEASRRGDYLEILSIAASTPA
jgi:hypothetical protein